MQDYNPGRGWEMAEGQEKAAVEPNP
jgi:hypothetical protein